MSPQNGRHNENRIVRRLHSFTAEIWIYWNPSIFLCLYGAGALWHRAQQVDPDFPLTRNNNQLSLGDAEELPYNPSSVSWSSTSWVCPTPVRRCRGRKKKSSWRCPGGILVRCPNHLSCLLFRQRACRKMCCVGPSGSHLFRLHYSLNLRS